MWFPTNWRWNHLLFFGNLKQIDKDRPWDFFSCSRNTYPVRPWDSPRVHQVVWRGCTVQQEEEIWLHRSLPLGKVSFFHVKKKAKEQKRRSWTKLFALIGKVPIFFHFEIWPFHPQGALSISFFIQKLTFHPQGAHEDGRLRRWLERPGRKTIEGGVLWRCPKISISPTDIYLINNKYGNENIFTIYCIREAVKNVLADFARSGGGYPPFPLRKKAFFFFTLIFR